MGGEANGGCDFYFGRDLTKNNLAINKFDLDVLKHQ